MKSLRRALDLTYNKRSPAQHVFVVKPKRENPQALQLRRSAKIILVSDSIEVRGPVQLDSELQLCTVKVDYESVDLVLTTELDLQDLTSAEDAPEQIFGRGLTLTDKSARIR